MYESIFFIFSAKEPLPTQQVLVVDTLPDNVEPIDLNNDPDALPGQVIIPGYDDEYYYGEPEPDYGPTYATYDLNMDYDPLFDPDEYGHESEDDTMQDEMIIIPDPPRPGHHMEDSYAHEQPTSLPLRSFTDKNEGPTDVEKYSNENPLGAGKSSSKNSMSFIPSDPLGDIYAKDLLESDRPRKRRHKGYRHFLHQQQKADSAKQKSDIAKLHHRQNSHFQNKAVT